MSSNTREHLGPDLLAIVECEHVIRPSWANQHSVRPALTSHIPPDTQQSGKNGAGFAGRPNSHRAAYAANDTVAVALASSSPDSIRSARTRKARARTKRAALSCVSAYVSTPGSSGTSAIHRPSSSCSNSIVRVIPTRVNMPRVGHSGKRRGESFVIRAGTWVSPPIGELTRESGEHQRPRRRQGWPEKARSSVELNAILTSAP